MNKFDIDDLCELTKDKIKEYEKEILELKMKLKKLEEKRWNCWISHYEK